MKLILLTGAGGNVGQMIRPMLRAKCRLRVSDVKDIARDGQEEFVRADLSDLGAVRRAVRGVDAVVHLGGYSLEADFETILPANIVGIYNLFEAARQEGVRRVIFASSGHVVGFYPRSQTIPVEVTLRPDSRYGVSKAFGEAIAGLYAYKYGAEVFTIRIGHILPRPETIRDLAIWLSPRDLCQLIEIGLETPGIRHEIVYGISDNQRRWWERDNAARLGYRPQDRAEDYAAEVIARDRGASGDDRVDRNQGADFCVAESMAPVS
ncbi:MAG: NAD(P)-dependent oxidoreductase [Bauldia sp.]